jgi:hypothetical protein
MHSLPNTARRVAAALLAAALATPALLALDALTASPAHAAAAAGADDVTWSVRTASNSFGAQRSSYRYTVNPGGRVTDAIVVSNNGDEPLSLGLYAADGFTAEAGQLDLLRPDQKQRGIGVWTHATAGTVDIAPGESTEVPFTLSVPKGSAPGDYAGGIVTTLTQPSQASGISVDRRLGIRISLRVSGRLAPGLSVTDTQAHWRGGLNPFAGGDATLSYTIRNTGNATLSARQAASAAGPFGLFPVTADKVAPPPPLLPGESRTITVPIHGVAAAFWFSATATVTPMFVDASGSTNPLTPVTSTAHGAAVPWMLIVIVLLVAALVVGVVLLLRRRRARAQQREDARVQDAVERALADAQETSSVES